MSNANQAEKIDDLRLLKFTGEDSLSFLQGQLSNDINQLDGNWQFSGYCNPKGRLLAILQLWKDEGAIYGLVDSSVCEALVKRLRMYVLRSKVTIELIESAICAGAIEPDGKPRFSLTVEDNVHILSYGGRQLSVYLNGEHGPLTGSNSWNNANINDGIPTINADTSELFVPQMVNLDLLDGINFKKGCYTGQEIVARMHYLGKLKQRMYVCDSGGTPRAGDKLVLDDKNAGTIVSVGVNSEDAKDKYTPVLAVLRTELLEQNPVLTLANGGDLSLRPSQPYAIPGNAT